MTPPSVSYPATHLEIRQRLPQVTMLHQVLADGTLWGTAGRAILRGNAAGWQAVGRFPFAAPRDLLGFARPTARALRADKCNLFVNTKGRVLGIRASIAYAIEPLGKAAPLFRIQGDCALHGGICEDRDGWTYIGEYFMNPERHPVRIWRLSPELDAWETAFEFPAGSIRHVHGVYRDPFDPDALWGTVGDYRGECFFYRTPDRFQTVQRFGDGTQIWRAVRLFFTPDYLCWLSDSQIEQNYACRIRRSGGQVEIGQPVDASTWYGTLTMDGLYVAFTTVEPGPGIHRNESLVLVSEDAFHWQEIHAFRKDFWRPMKVFKYGVVSCPSGPMSSQELYLSGEGLVGLDGVSACVRIVRGAS